MKENQGEKNKIYQKYREVLEMPDLTEEELFKIHTHFMQFGRILYEYYLDSDNLKKVKALKKN